MNATVLRDPNIRNIQFQTYGETVINPVALMLTILMVILILTVERRYAVVPMIVISTAVTFMQRIVIAGLDFDMLRILIVAAMIRVVLRNEYHAIKFHTIDKLILGWLLVRFLAQVLLWQTTGRLIYNLGFLYNAVGMYYLLRMLIRDREDIRITFSALLIASIFVSLSMLNEQITGRNLFGQFFGGVPARTLVREGRLRSQAAFSHPILAGSFGAGILPLAWGLLREGPKHRTIGIIGLVTSPLIVATASSSGPVMAFAGGLFAIAMWKYRLQTRTFFWMGVIALIGLELAMEAPVYALIYRVAVVGGSTGFHRYMLIDQAVRRFSEWWLLGTRSSAHWGWGLQDVTNMYIREGIDGGVFGMVLFALANWFMFRAIAVVVKRNPYKDSSRLVWGLGASLFAHNTSFFGVSYFGQMLFFWYLTAAMIGSLWQLEAVPNGVTFYGRDQYGIGGRLKEAT